MRRFTLLLCAVLLTGCGIKGGLDRPPPLWGDGTKADVPEETTTAESVDATVDPINVPVDPFTGEPLEEDDADAEYGVDVAD